MATKKYKIDLDNPPSVSKDDLARFDSIKDGDIDYSDIPDMSDVDFEIAKKTGVYTRLDTDVLNWFKGQGKGYQTRINAVLRAFYLQHKDQESVK